MKKLPESTASGKSWLARAATLLAVGALVCFGLCSLGVLVVINKDGRLANVVGTVAIICGYLVPVCLFGLLLVGLVWVKRRFFDGSGKDE